MVEGSENSYKLTLEPDNAIKATSNSAYTVSISGDSEGAWIENDHPRAVILYAGTEGTVEINVYLTNWPDITVSKTVTVIKEPITEIETYLSTDQELICGTNSHLVVSNNDASIDLSRLNFVSTDESVATIDEEGYIKTLSPGTTEVYAENAEDSSVVSEPIEITVTDGNIVKPTSIDVEPIQVYAKTLNSVDAVFNDGSECSDSLYKITADDDSFIRQGELLYSDEATEPMKIKVSSVYDPSVYCETTVEFVEVKCTGLVLENTSFSLPRNKRHAIVVDVESEVDGVDVTYDELSYEIIDGEEHATLTNNVVVCTRVAGTFTVRVTLVHDPSFYLEASFTTYHTSQNNTGTFVEKFVGHYLLYAANGVLAFLTAYFFCWDEKKSVKSIIIWLVVFIAIGVALSFLGELIQYLFSATRGASLSDAGLNIGGFMSGFLITGLILLIIRLVKRHRQKNLQNNLTKGI